MMSQIDHPLSHYGRAQAAALQRRIAQRRAAAPEDALSSQRQSPRLSQAVQMGAGPTTDRRNGERSVDELVGVFLATDVIFSSPLTRAVQTAMIGLKDSIEAAGQLRLMTNAREKRNVGGRDTQSSSSGAAGAGAMNRIDVLLLDWQRHTLQFGRGCGRFTSGI